MHDPIINTNSHVLPLVAKELISQGFSSLEHCRVSYESQINSAPIYQGLTKASYEHNLVMVKWQLTAGITTQYSSLLHEITCIKHILAQPTAVKIIPSFVLKNGVLPIINEDRSSISINNTCRTLIYFTIPYSNCGSVADYLKRQQMNRHPLDQQSLLSLLISTAKSIAHLHSLGWVHGDIKPSNVLVIASHHYQTSLIDFGLTQSIHDLNHKLVNSPLQPRGTPAYLAPECWQGQAISVQSDIYAFGVLMYEVLEGVKPYRVNDNRKVPTADKSNPTGKDSAVNKGDKQTQHFRALATLHCQAPIPVFTNVNWYALQPVLDKLLAKTKDKRYQNMIKVWQDLEKAGEGLE